MAAPAAAMQSALLASEADERRARGGGPSSVLGADNAAASFCPPNNLGKSSCTVLEHEYDLSQAAGAGASCEEPELSQALGAGPGESSLYTEEPDEIDMSQPVVAAPPKALFSLVGGAAASFNGLPPLIFELPAEQGVRMRFGRRLPAAGAIWLDGDLLSPYDYWQFWRNTDDADVGRFLRLFTDMDMAEIAKLEALEGAEINEAKKVLAHEATSLLHGALM